MESLSVSPIHLFNQNVNDHILTYVLRTLYSNVRFSTFPYFTYKCETSYSALHRYNSGNCIAISIFMQKFLDCNYGIKSNIICANVPDIYKVEGTPHACHCALLVPKSMSEFYILDGAFSFLTPLYCDLNQNVNRLIDFTDIYAHENHSISYHIEKLENPNIDTKFEQNLLPESLIVKCNFDFDDAQTWNYYLNQVDNPDESIGIHFLFNKPLPFILYTYYDNIENKVKLKYKLYINEEGFLILKEYPNDSVIFSSKNINFTEMNEINKVIRNYMNKHFDDYII